MSARPATARAGAVDPCLMAELNSVATRIERLERALGGFAELLEGLGGVAPHPGVLGAIVGVMAGHVQDIVCDMDGALLALTRD